MKIALIGASGQAGSRILKELSDRGHAITAIARNPDKIAKLPGVTARKGDVFDKEGLAELIEGHDAVVSSVHFTASDPDTLIAAVRASGVKRYLVVGGAGSLEVAPGKRLVDAPEFPAIYKTEAQKGADFLDTLR
ncbi:NAD-dependent epimerase/dehydratase family protein, partial [Mesorhizobium sp. M4A.F.Ca.ET.029.04.2.1]